MRRHIILLAIMLLTCSLNLFGQQDSDFIADYTLVHPCNDQLGSIEVDIFGESDSYIIQWLHGPTDLMLSDLNPGIYELSISNLYGCTEYYTFKIFGETPCDITGSIDYKICNCTADLFVDIQNSNGLDIVVTWQDGYIGGLERTVSASSENTYYAEITIGECCSEVIFFNVEKQNCSGLSTNQSLIVNETNS